MIFIYIGLSTLHTATHTECQEHREYAVQQKLQHSCLISGLYPTCGGVHICNIFITAYIYAVTSCCGKIPFGCSNQSLLLSTYVHLVGGVEKLFRLIHVKAGKEFGALEEHWSVSTGDDTRQITKNVRVDSKPKC